MAVHRDHSVPPSAENMGEEIEPRNTQKTAKNKIGLRSILSAWPTLRAFGD
jgi:hypothetical protein